jgi:hypothetical protein
MDTTQTKGNNSISQDSFIHYSNEQVVHNLNALGISLGNSLDSVSSSISRVKELELKRLETQPNTDRICHVFDKEEREEMENEEIDKLILNLLCGEIMDEVMDLGIAYPMDCKNTPGQKSSSSSKNRKKSKEKGKK